MPITNTAARYTALESIRQPILDRARECSAITLPYLIPPQGSSEGQRLPTPYQSLGSRGVTVLNARILTAILPPNTSFFRLDIDEFAAQELSQNPGMKASIEAGLSQIERTTCLSIESSNIRVGIHESLAHLIVGGNALVYVRPEGGIRVYGIDSYVVQRDPAGNPIEIIAKEQVAREALPEEVQALVPVKDGQANTGAPDNHNLYTHLKRVSKAKWEVVQAINDVPIPGSDGGYPADLFPWLALRWNRVDGESYGRSHVEAYLGDLKSLEALSKAVIDFAQGAAKVIPLVNPNGVTDEKELAEAENFQFVSGVADDVSFLRIDKYADLQVAKQMIDDLSRRLAQAFLMTSSIQRSGERVTAEEIRLMATELEETVGGVYALIAQELQLPLVNIIMGHLTKAKRLPALPKGIVSPTITTGLDALSRSNDLMKLDRMMAGLRDLYGPETLAAETNVSDYIKRRGAALSINIDGLIKSEEEKAAEMQRRQQAAMMETLGPNMINQMGNMAKAGMEQPQ